MRWFFSAHIATRRLLISQQYLHGGSASRGNSCFQKLNRNLLPIPSLLSGHQYYCTSSMVEDTESSYRSSNRSKHENNNNKLVDLVITSTDIIKPSSPTPQHLRTFDLSILDQIFHDCYTPLILFFPNNNEVSVTEVVNRLKKSLSEILTRFYPFAGEVMDDLHIECNDKGVYLLEARVRQRLEDFLLHPNDAKVRVLNPKSPTTGESSVGNYVIGVQVNIFSCGGIGLSTSVTHKLFDGHTYFMFMKAWATTARGSPEAISPSFVASEVFPNNPSLKYSVASMLMTTESVSTKRFVFNSTALSLLKAQPVASSPSHPPTRMEATTSVIWKAAAKASSTIRPFGPQSPHVLFSFVNLRKRASPPLPNNSIGNIIDTAAGICHPVTEPDLPTLISEIRNSIARINPEHINCLKGENGPKAFNEVLSRVNHLADVSNGHCVFVTSLLNSGIYGIDFGWGKPIWFYDMNAGFSRIVALNDTLKGGGVEATVTLSSDEMEIFEHDAELLSYASVDPSPLQFVKD